RKQSIGKRSKRERPGDGRGAFIFAVSRTPVTRAVRPEPFAFRHAPAVRSPPGVSAPLRAARPRARFRVVLPALPEWYSAAEQPPAAAMPPADADAVTACAPDRTALNR